MPGVSARAPTAIRRCRDDERSAVFEIINAAAEAYRAVIPGDRWREPYMPLAELDEEIARGVAFWGFEASGSLIGLMGLQRIEDVDLIRHAYVLPGMQRLGVGGQLLGYLQHISSRRMLVGTWAAADWAIQFYRRHGFELVSTRDKTALLERYWTIPQRQIATSVVLANPPLDRP